MIKSNAKAGPVALIIDDHRIVADGIAQMLTSHALAQDVRILTGLAPLLAETRFDDLGFAIIDFGLAGKTGLEAVEHLHSHAPGLPCILMTGSTLSRAERADMQRHTGFLYHKQDPVERLVDLVSALPGHQPQAGPPGVAKEVSPGLMALHRLTSREREILRSLGRGHPVEVIAGELCISPATVRKHRENMMSKLAVRSSARLVRIAMQAGLA
jgi:DNA-binding NarL/FixJ family response regulator